MADEEFKLNFDKSIAEANGSWVGGPADWIWNFGKSAVLSVPELVGITPGEETLRWRAANPGSGFVSELAGMAVPYGGWMRAARSISALEALATGVEAAKLGTEAGKAAHAAKLLEAPFMTAGKAEMVRLAPFELGRVAASQVLGDQPLSEMAFGAGLNMALGGAVMGGFAKAGAIGKVAPGIRDIAPEVDAYSAPQLMARKLDEIIPTRPDAPDLVNLRMDLGNKIRTETPAKGDRYVVPELAGEKDALERMFDPSRPMRNGYVETLMPAEGQAKNVFATGDEWRGLLGGAGIDPALVETHMQYPRVVRMNAAKEIEYAEKIGATPEFDETLKHASWLEDTVKKSLKPVGDGWFLAREPQDGMFVMAKKVVGETGGVVPPREFYVGRHDGKIKTWRDKAEIPADATNVKTKLTKERTLSKPGVDDTWLLFKTDKPGDFVKNSQGFMNTTVARDRWIVGPPPVEALSKDPGIVGELLRLEEKTPWGHYADAAQAARGDTSKVGQIVDKFTPNVMKNAGLLQAGRDFLREFASPFARQFKHNPRANWTANMGRLIDETAHSFYQKLRQGELTFDGPRAVLAKVINVPGPRTDLEALWTAISKEGLLEDIMRLRREGIGAEGAATMASEGKLKPRAAALAKELEDALRMEHEDSYAKALVANGKKAPEFKPGNYGLPKALDGDYLQVIRDEAGKIRGLVAGGSSKAATQKAEKLAAQLQRETGARHKPGEAFLRHADRASIPSDAVPLIRNPNLLESQNIRGFRWDMDTPTLSDVLSEINIWGNGRARTVSQNIREATLTRHMAALSVEDPQAYKNLAKRFEMMSGLEGSFSKAQNQATDKVLSRFGFGSNTATKTVQYLNTGMTHVQLGALKMSYPLQNLAGVLQVVAPELAMVMNAPAEHLIHQYGMTAAAVGSRGTVGSISTLSPMKMMGQGIRMMINPTAEERAAINWGLNSRTLESRVAEEYIGQGRRTLANWKGALTSPKAFMEFALALSEWLPMHSERFSRTLAFTSAYRTFRDVVGITDETLLRQHVKTFVERTNFTYSSADRPLAFTSPLGSAMGLFKNWQMNYIHLMAEYANLGVTQGVWSPLIWQTMATAAVGGVAATPLFAIADGAANFFSQKKLIQLAYDEWGSGADGVMFGLPAALTGVSLSSLMTEPGANPVKDATQLFSFATWNRMKEAGGVVHAAMDNWQATGQHPASDPDVRNGLIKAFAPVLIQRAMAVDDDVVRNPTTGMVSAKGLSVYDRFMYQWGLQPVTIERQMAASNALYEDREKMKSATKAFGDAVQEGLKAGRNIDHILERARALGVDTSSVFKSAFARNRLEDKTSAQRLAKPATLAAWENVLGY